MKKYNTVINKFINEKCKLFGICQYSKQELDVDELMKKVGEIIEKLKDEFPELYTHLNDYGFKEPKLIGKYYTIEKHNPKDRANGLSKIPNEKSFKYWFNDNNKNELKPEKNFYMTKFLDILFDCSYKEYYNKNRKDNSFKSNLNEYLLKNIKKLQKENDDLNLSISNTEKIIKKILQSTPFTAEAELIYDKDGADEAIKYLKNINLSELEKRNKESSNEILLLASFYAEKQQDREAEKYFKKSISIFKTVENLLMYGIFLIGKSTESIKFIDQALLLQKSKINYSDENQLFYLYSILEIVTAYYYSENNNKSLFKYLDQLVKSLRNLTKINKEYIYELNLYISLYASRMFKDNEIDKAEKLYEEAIEINYKIPCDPTILKMRISLLNNLIQIYLFHRYDDLGKLKLAKKLSINSIKLMKKTFNKAKVEDYEQLAGSLYIHATILQALSDYKGAVEYTKETLDILKNNSQISSRNNLINQAEKYLTTVSKMIN